MKTIITILSLVLLVNLSQAQPKNENLTALDPRLNNGFLMKPLKLSIAEYKGQVPVNASGASDTKMLMGFSKLQALEIKGTKGKYLFRILPYFSFNSWLIDTVKHDSALLKRVLNHEQIHYDIHLLAAAELKKQLNNTWFDINKYADAMIEIRSKISFTEARINQLYQTETAGGRDAESQKRWDELVAQQNWQALVEYIKGKI